MVVVAIMPLTLNQIIVTEKVAKLLLIFRLIKVIVAYELLRMNQITVAKKVTKSHWLLTLEWLQMLLN